MFMLQSSMHDFSTFYCPYIIYDFKSNIMHNKTCVVQACFTKEELCMDTIGKPIQYTCMFILYSSMYDFSTIYRPYIIHDFKSNIMHKKTCIVVTWLTNKEVGMKTIGIPIQYLCMFILNDSMHDFSTIYGPYIVHDFKSNIMHKKHTFSMHVLPTKNYA